MCDHPRDPCADAYWLFWNHNTSIGQMELQETHILRPLRRAILKDRLRVTQSWSRSWLGKGTRGRDCRVCISIPSCNPTYEISWSFHLKPATSHNANNKPHTVSNIKYLRVSANQWQHMIKPIQNTPVPWCFRESMWWTFHIPQHQIRSVDCICLTLTRFDGQNSLPVILPVVSMCLVLTYPQVPSFSSTCSER